MRGAILPLPHYVLMALFLVKHRENFTFTITFCLWQLSLRENRHICMTCNIWFLWKSLHQKALLINEFGAQDNVYTENCHCEHSHCCSPTFSSNASVIPNEYESWVTIVCVTLRVVNSMQCWESGDYFSGWRKKQLTNSLGQSPLKADGGSAGQETPPPPPGPFMLSEYSLPCSQKNRHYTQSWATRIHSYNFIKIHFNITLPCTLTSPLWSLFFRFSG
jgi:hypothetical protein